ncbi:MAG: 3-deoxy-manno-octulosonate cytidylyltransferase [Bacteroidales bacterium]|nr:3-deoxy-manno-octulosonate cytidylyltransferase [Bacteroidales bacterium]
MKVLAIIPARYASTRFPGKPLAELAGESIISRVYHRVRRTDGIEDVVVATDDESICDHVESFAEEGAVMMTSDEHRSGTDRCGEVVSRLARQGYSYDVILNVQGDEPFVEPDQLQALMACFSNPEVQIATLATRVRKADELLSENNVKVVRAADGRALYFSRQPIPFCRGAEPKQWLDRFEYLKHVGIYAFRADVLPELCRLASGPLEEAEKLEQLRWLEAGYSIQVELTDHANIGIDTPDDLAAAEQYLKQKKSKRL